MTELQKVEFDILKCVDGICKKLNIKYFLVCGSALGAVKYGGFIPWDDDFDIGMFREDYETFLNSAQEYLPDCYSVQNFKTSKYYPLNMTKIRDNRTTCIQRLYDEIDMNHGVYIDVFPLDGLPDSQRGIERLQKKQKDYARKCSVRYNYQGLSAREIGIRTYIYRLLFKYFNAFSSTDVYVRKTDELYREVSISDSDYICSFANWQGEKEYAPKFQYGEGVFMSFEGLEVRLPSKYDEYLTQKYGDWRADLPEDQKVGSHNFEILDLEKPYTHYVEKLSNGKIRIKNIV